MKKLLVCMLLIIMMCVQASAEINLSGMTYEELLDLQRQVTLAMWECEEWQEVTVPKGVYKVGVDIPAGKWVICAEKNGWTNFHCGDGLNATETDTKMIKQMSILQVITDPNRWSFDADHDVPELVCTLPDGWYVAILGGNAIFKPYTGNRKLEFK